MSDVRFEGFEEKEEKENKFLERVKMLGFLPKVKEWVQKAKPFAILTLVIALGTSVILGKGSDASRKALAQKTVKLLYDFGTLDQLEDQQRDLAQCVTTPVFNQLTYDNEERRLNTYLKFNGETCTVHFEKVTSDYVIYTLECSGLEDNRYFLFSYHTKGNKIDDVYEAELVGFTAGGPNDSNN